LAYGSQSGKQLSPFMMDKDGRLKWQHKIDEPTVQVLTGEEGVYSELYWPDRVRHRGSSAIGECSDGEFNFRKSASGGNVVSILRNETTDEVGQIRLAVGRPSIITLSNGHGYKLRNEGFLKEDWVLVDESEQPLFRIKRVFPDVEVSGEVEMLGEGSTGPPMVLLLMATWYAVQ